MKFFVATCLAFVAASGCTGSIVAGSASPDTEGGQSGSGGGANAGGDIAEPVIDPEQVLGSKACDEINPGSAPMRRLSNAEYRHTVSDLLGMAAQVRTFTADFTPENESLGFRNNAEFLPVSSLAAEQFSTAADKLSAAAAADPNFVKCANPSDKAACAKEFIGNFGTRAYRRPLTTEEVTRFTTMFNAAMTKYDFSAGVEWVVNAMLQSPYFLFRYEAGKALAGKSYAAVDHYEMASRLSYLLWQSMPDAALFDAAKQGKLGTAAEVLAQAKRMIGDTKAERSLEFFRQWLDTDQLDRFSRDATVFKNLPGNLATLFDGEVAAFTRDLMMGGQGTFADLMSAPYTYVNADLAKHYGIGGTFGTEFTRTNSATASGVLTQAGFLTVHDKPTRTSIVLRGVKVRTDVMCELIPAPPANVPLNLDKLSSGLTQKERLAMHRTDPSCSGCHNLIDPVGVVFEGYDAVGRPRTMEEAGKPVDTNSEITSSVDLDGKVANPLEFGKKLAASNAAQQCYLAQNFRFFYGRDYTNADLCSRGQLTKAWKDAGFNLKQMLVSLTQTDAFLYRPQTN
ncbi:MAG: DUF1592 domain-containing protein [Deltaproteobacteria bacterium]|nr:DUF1592 domain-containing protein [Deltaproteobacteria bacterium]